MSTTPRDQKEINNILVVHASIGDCAGVQTLIRLGADIMFNNGLPVIVAAAKGDSYIIRVLVSAGLHDPDILNLASRIALANNHFKDALYLSTWADRYRSGLFLGNHNPCQQ